MYTEIDDQNQINSKGFIRLSEILKLIPISRSSWWAGVKSGKFPQSVKLGERTTAWRSVDIQNLLNSFTK